MPSITVKDSSKGRAPGTEKKIARNEFLTKDILVARDIIIKGLEIFLLRIESKTLDRKDVKVIKL